MSSMVAVRLILVVTLALACGGAPTPMAPSDVGATGTSDADRLEDELGGRVGLMAFFDSNSDATIANALKAHSIGFARDDETLTECESTFPDDDRATWHAFDGEFYFIDSSGRPSRAYKYLPPVVAAERIESCQGSVGRWGDAEDESNDCDGGHMIGSQLGGCGGAGQPGPAGRQLQPGQLGTDREQGGRLCFTTRRAHPVRGARRLR